MIDYRLSVRTLSFISQNTELFSVVQAESFQLFIRPIREANTFTGYRNKKIKKKPKSLFVYILNLISVIKLQKKVNRVGSQEDRRKQPQQKSPKKASAAGQQSSGAPKGSKKKQGALSSHYSGFRTTPEVEHVELGDGKKRQKILPMPSHTGPKIRY